MSDSVSPGHAAAGTNEAGNWVPPGVGARLRLARELRQMSVNDVAQALKLGSRQVQALENGNWQGLPGQTFVRGFVRNYARLLQIDPTPLMDQLDDTLEKPADSLNVPVGRPTIATGMSFWPALSSCCWRCWPTCCWPMTFLPCASVPKG